MERWLCQLVGLLGLLACLAGAVAAGHRAQGRAYSAGAIRAGLDRHPGAWDRRTVRVCGRLVLYPPRGRVDCTPRIWRPMLLDPVDGSALAVIWQPPGRAEVVLRGAPLLGALLPDPQALHWGALGIDSRPGLLARAGCPRAAK
jgi:hypothetical protein